MRHTSNDDGLWEKPLPLDRLTLERIKPRFWPAVRASTPISILLALATTALQFGTRHFAPSQIDMHLVRQPIHYVLTFLSMAFGVACWLAIKDARYEQGIFDPSPTGIAKLVRANWRLSLALVLLFAAWGWIVSILTPPSLTPPSKVVEMVVMSASGGLLLAIFFAKVPKSPAGVKP